MFPALNPQIEVLQYYNYNNTYSTKLQFCTTSMSRTSFEASVCIFHACCLHLAESYGTRIYRGLHDIVVTGPMASLAFVSYVDTSAESVAVATKRVQI